MAAESMIATSPTTRTSRPVVRATRVGVVTSDARDKTIRVTLQYQVQHPKYGKYLRRRTVLHVHDEKNEARVGDTVEVMECRPISKTKSWRLLRVLQRAPQQADERAARRGQEARP
jgi:small subunit ribosomal protein S17